uniref:Chromo domain-containing protein n=1 Tax=Panagrolaimus sp. ES5 TaxID=591445 RepID=A0AC34G2F9_9BILA
MASNVYEVEEILEMRVYKNGIRKFKVKWFGFRPFYNSWVREIDMDCPDLLKEFLKNHRLMKQQKKAIKTKPVSSNRYYTNRGP